MLIWFLPVCQKQNYKENKERPFKNSPNLRLFFLFWATLIAKTFATVFLLKEGVTTFRELTAVCFQFETMHEAMEKETP